ncbi:glyoxalase [uncultured Chryseobacterium sp.]|uniref:glyoxalase n=1 Tax=uncultured Chryseobacterium sp. TaxID=259322 RepID=UPI0025ECB929|nr:glyoxalase [uncultured Chryseobacterium sp.]
MISKSDLRTPLSIPINEASTPAERFQNQVLRPVLKLQNDLYISLFSNYASRQAPAFSSLTTEKKHLLIEQSLQKDTVLKNTLIGISIGMLTGEELETYISDSKTFNKRILAMITERIKSQVK